MKTPKSAALQFHEWGANVNAIAPLSKGPLNDWADIQHRRQTQQEVQQLPWGRAAGVGVMNGPGGWRTFDIDPKKKDEYGNKLADEDIKPVPESSVLCILQALGLSQDYAWVGRSGSGKGWGIAVICYDTIPAGVLHTKDDDAGVFVGLPKDGHEFGQIELRVQDCQTIFPPSAYSKPNAPGYQWRGDAPTSPPSVVTAGHVLNAFFAVATPKRAKTEDEPKTSKPSAQKVHTADSDAVIAEIKQHFDLVAYAQQHYGNETQKEPNGEIRILGHGGFLINPKTQIWNNFTEEVGGDCIELVGYRLYGHRWDRYNRVMFHAVKLEAAAFAGVTLPEPQHPKPQFAVSPEVGDVVTIPRTEYERLKGFESWVTELAAIPSERLSPAAKVVALSLRPKMDSMDIWKCEEPLPIYIGDPKDPNDDGAAKRAGLSADTYGAKLKELDDVGAIKRETRRNHITGRPRVFVQPDNFFDPANWTPSEPRAHGGHHPKNNRPAPECSTHGAEVAVGEETTVVKQRYCGDCLESLGVPTIRRERKIIWDPNNPNIEDQLSVEVEDDDPNPQVAVSPTTVLYQPQVAAKVARPPVSIPLIEPVGAPGVHSRLIDADDPWFAYQRSLQGQITGGAS